jgi:hypothetical protein
MAIPGLKPTFEVVAKVRVGKKSERNLPQSVDYFICDDDDFNRVVGEGKQSLRILLPFAKAEDAFSTGLEWWAGKMLVCYSKGDEIDGKPVALRLESMRKDGRDVNLLAGTESLSDEVVGRGRRKIVCPVRDCEFLKNKTCKPMGRLQFYIDGIDGRRGVYQLDTKAWNSIENIEATLSRHTDLRGVPFILRVEFTQKGRDRFPELYLEEDMDVKNEADAVKADALLQLSKRISGVKADDSDENVAALKLALAELLDITNPGWRDDEVVTGWVSAQGLIPAGESLLRRHLG